MKKELVLQSSIGLASSALNCRAPTYRTAQKKCRKFFNQASIFPPDLLQNSAGTLSLCCSGDAPVSI